MRVNLPLDKKKLENKDNAIGPPGRQTSMPNGKATGRWAVGRGPLGGGPAFSKAKRSVIVAVVCMYIFLTIKVIL